ncbi:hypothetical protein BaRGS_00005068 [Batillaria attramentaria]|uniref:V-type proton ATPase subunit S1/VOA1 transmembrane domain-containing protein n=1 Tax=Batillaria attramentaria TaxID=370345 RepID=A0ABD0LWV7_9CAEN
MATSLLFLILSISSTLFASDVPVLIWSPDRPLSDLPQAPAVHSISQDTFHTKYLKPLLKDEGHVIVAFLQDKLHINDISKYADVYNPSSDGGAFKNIKGLLDEHFSLELPHVLDSHQALSSLRSKFPGTVHDVDPATDLSSLDLGGKQNYLLIVRLAPVASAKNEEAAITANDNLVGKVADHLQKRSVRYTALYTAEASESTEEGGHFARRLMADVPDVDTKGIFFNASYSNGSAYAYLTSISFCLYDKYDPEKPPEQCYFKFTSGDLSKITHTTTAQDLGNSTLLLTMKLDGVSSNQTAVKYNITLNMPFKLMYDRWIIETPTVSLLSANGNSSISATNRSLDTRMYEYDLVASLLYSYHCSAMDFMESPTTNSTPIIGRFTLGGFQVQPFNTSHKGFSLSQDCTGWFTTAIWMGIIPVALNIIVLLLGMYMIASLSTNDRFDDPKGKTLTINAGE